MSKLQKIDHERCEAELAGLVLLMQKKDQFIGVDQSTVVIKKFEIPCRSISYRYGQSFDSPPDCELNAVYLDTSTNFMYMLINHVQYVSEMPVNPNRQYCSDWQLLEAIGEPVPSNFRFFHCCSHESIKKKAFLLL